MADTKDLTKKEEKPVIGVLSDAPKKDSEPEEKKVEPAKKTEEPEEPRCTQCKGSGVFGTDRIGNGTICTVCAGTGKVKN